MSKIKHETSSLSLPIERLNAATWNTHAAAKKSDPEFKGLVASIKNQGVIQRVVVRSVDGGYEIIDGHRRVEAAKAAGLKVIPCEVYESLDDETAQAMTATANIQRLENDPLLEAALIERMTAAGKTHKQIAAVLGKSESYITRRARLTALTEGWRRAYALADEKPNVSDLELIAAHEPELQDKVLELNADEEDGSVDWSENFEYDFNRYMMELDEEKCGFNVDGCNGCKHNTAIHGALLFPEFEDDTACGRCQNAECFMQKWNAATDAQIEKLRKQGVEVKEVKQKWDIPNSYNATKNKEPKNSVPYVYTEDGIRKLLWSVPKSEPVAVARTAEEIAAEKAEKKRQKILRDARNAMRTHIAEVFKTADIMESRFENLARMCLKRTMTQGWFNDDVCDDYAALVGGLDALPEELAKVYAAELKEIEKAKAKE